MAKGKNKLNFRITKYKNLNLITEIFYTIPANLKQY